MCLLQKIPLPENLRGKQHILFGNISEIYSKSKDFLKTLKTCGYDHEKMADAFLNFVSGLIKYLSYSLIKRYAEKLFPTLCVLLEKSARSTGIFTRI